MKKGEEVQDIPKILVAISLFVVILLTFVVTIKVLGQGRYINPPPETVYVDLGDQHVRARFAIVERPELVAAENQEVPTNG